jgi:hypothetical protein
MANPSMLGRTDHVLGSVRLGHTANNCDTRVGRILLGMTNRRVGLGQGKPRTNPRACAFIFLLQAELSIDKRDADLNAGISGL